MMVFCVSLGLHGIMLLRCYGDDTPIHTASTSSQKTLSRGDLGHGWREGEREEGEREVLKMVWSFVYTHVQEI